MLQGSGGACILGLTWENKVCHFCHEGYWWWWHTWIVCLQYLFNINFAASETMPPDRSCSGSNRPGLAQEIFHVFGFIARDGLRNFSCVCICVCQLRKFPNPFLLCRRQRATSKPSVFTHQYWVPYRWGDWKTYLHAPYKKKWVSIENKSCLRDVFLVEEMIYSNRARSVSGSRFRPNKFCKIK